MEYPTRIISFTLLYGKVFVYNTLSEITKTTKMYSEHDHTRTTDSPETGQHGHSARAFGLEYHDGLKFDDDEIDRDNNTDQIEDDLIGGSDDDSNNGKDEKTTAAAPATATSVLIREELGEITEKMGKLWWPTSNQELTKIYERDKHGRLVPAEDKPTRGRAAKGTRIVRDNGGGGKYNRIEESNKSGAILSEFPAATAGGKSPSNVEWYNNVIPTAHMATVNLVGKVEDSNASYIRADPKLATSLALASTIDKVWSKELYEMDAREREDVLNEIHGIKSDRAIEETPESIKEAVQSFRENIDTNIEKELDNSDSIVPGVTKDAYKRGVNELKNDYILSNAFIVKFLRYTLYDMEKAVLRYFRWLDLLYLLFGDDALTRPLALRDLTKREIRYLRKGQMQLLPSRDRVGRRIFAFSGCDDWHFNIREKYRINIYLVDVMSDDVTTQKLGAVSLNAPRIRSNDSPFGFEGMTLRMGKQELLGGKCTEAQFFRKINEAVPVRFTAIHYFAPPTIIYNIGKAIILSLLGKDHRKIVRFHAGSQLECNYGLRSFGIPHEDITITEGNNIKTKNVQKFMNARRSIESFREKQRERKLRQKQQQKNEAPLEAESSSNGRYEEDKSEFNMDIDIDEEFTGIECPGVDCVVFGDKTMNGLPANVEFREMIKTMEHQREEKLNNCEGDVLPIKQFIESVLEEARSPRHNLRFLVFDKVTHLFVDIDNDNELCKRVSQALRDQRKRARIEGRRLTEAIKTHQDRRPPAPRRGDNNSGRVLDEAGGSIMGLDAAKRLKRSYSYNSNPHNADTNCFFCTRRS
jgi:hypothetical protein